MSESDCQSQRSWETQTSGRTQTITFYLRPDREQHLAHKRKHHRNVSSDCSNRSTSGSQITSSINIVAPTTIGIYHSTKRNANTTRTDVMAISLKTNVMRPLSSPAVYNGNGVSRSDVIKPPQSTMVHVGMAACRPSILPQQQSRRVTFEKLEENGVRFKCLSCHDWRCKCTCPLAVGRFPFICGEPSYNAAASQHGSWRNRPTVYRQQYMVPRGCRLGRRRPDTNQSLLSLLPGNKTPSDGGSNQSMTESEDSAAYERHLAELVRKRKEREAIETVLANKPVSVPGPFLVSSPHWAARTHTQRWSWRGGRLHQSALTFQAAS